ncbi:uncharacterized protein LOC143856568 [Tasmannia lanceolata]|uniref:uncharacterized protein LOC143856568 n=1 Tax=Tasmannia lanceolata TaxID=3420 RepID=UPI00406453C0
MEQARVFLALKKEEEEGVSQLTVIPHRRGVQSFFEGFSLRNVQVDRIEPGFIACTFKVPPRLTDATGNLSSGAIATIVDAIGGAAIVADGLPLKATLNMAITYLSNAKANDELEIITRTMGHKGALSGASVIVSKKITGDLIATCQLSCFGKVLSKI